MYTHEWTVRFSDCDPFGIAHYPRIVDAVHEVADRFMESIGFSFGTLAQEHDCGFPLIEIDLQFREKLQVDDVVTVGLCTELGNSSVRFVYEAHRGDTLAFEGFEQRACVSTEDGDAFPIPDDIREGLASAACE